MTDDDRFELELAALRPREVSTELKQRIADDLAATPLNNGESPRRFWWPIWRGPLPVPHRDRARGYEAVIRALAGGILAASLAVVILWRGEREAVESPSIPPLEASVAAAFDKSYPSLWSYRSALSRPSAALDEVLDKYSAQTLEHKPGGAPDLFAARFRSDMNSLLGEL